MLVLRVKYTGLMPELLYDAEADELNRIEGMAFRSPLSLPVVFDAR